jgi:hypothetical protein
MANSCYTYLTDPLLSFLADKRPDNHISPEKGFDELQCNLTEEVTA